VSGTWTGRLVVAAVALVVLAPLGLMVRSNVLASENPQFCKGVYLVPDTSTGASDPRAALEHLLQSGREPSLPTSGWTGPSATDEFTSGSARVTVEKLEGRTGWFATGVCIADGNPG
jgi:hypothetical protein